MAHLLVTGLATHRRLETPVFGLFRSGPSVPDFSFSSTSGTNLQPMDHMHTRIAECDINTFLDDRVILVTKDWTFALDHPGLQICSPSQSSEDVLDIGVVTSRFRDGDTQLSIAEGSHSCDDACHYPDDESQAHRASVLQHTLW